MANYKIVNADQLDADLQKIADAVRTKGGTSEELAFPGGFVSAVENISTGIDVRRVTGSVYTNANEDVFVEVNCDFCPDLVYLYNPGDTESAKTTSAGLCFAEEERADEIATLFRESEFAGKIEIRAKQTDSGFQIATDSGFPMELNFAAVKYTT